MGKRFQVAVGRKKTDVKTRLGVRGAAKKPQGASVRLSGTATRSQPQPKSSIDGKWTHDLFASTLRAPKAAAGASRAGRGAVRAMAVTTTRGGAGGVAKTTRRQPVSTRLGSAVVGGRGGRLASVVVASPPQRGAVRARAVSRAVTLTSGRGGGGRSAQGDVGGLLASLGLAKYNGLFAREEVDMDALSCMTESDLQLMGIPMGPRKKILNAFQ